MTAAARKDNYPIVVFWSDEDESWIADVPDLQSLSTHGETAEEAVRELMIAREAWLEVVREYGHPLPDPRDSRFCLALVQEQFQREAALAASSGSATVSAKAGMA